MNNLSKCVEALKDVRRSFNNEADPGAADALDAVIARFESCLAEAETDEVSMELLVREALLVLSSLVNCCHGVAELIERFRG